MHKGKMFLLNRLPSIELDLEYFPGNVSDYVSQCESTHSLIRILSFDSIDERRKKNHSN